MKRNLRAQSSVLLLLLLHRALICLFARNAILVVVVNKSRDECVLSLAAGQKAPASAAAQLAATAALGTPQLAARARTRVMRPNATKSLDSRVRARLSGRSGNSICCCCCCCCYRETALDNKWCRTHARAPVLCACACNEACSNSRCGRAQVHTGAIKPIAGRLLFAGAPLR